tara:strand:+ start:3794 stop:4330 length:537 start_codon:yes stop_codon:yes gene_type:complete
MAKKLDLEISGKIRKYLGKQTQTKTITEISRSLDIGRNTVAKYLELLKIQGLVEERTVGQAKLWSLTATPFDSDKFGFSIRDMDGRHIYSYGAKALSKFGFNETTFQGKTTSEALGENYSDVDKAALEAINTEKLAICHRIYESRKVQAKVVQYFFPNYDKKGNLTGTISFASISDTR